MAIQRRDVLAGAGALLVAGVAHRGVQDASAAQHAHHAPSKTTVLLDNVIACGATGELCIDHCFELLKGGDTAIAGCAESVHEMLAVNAALQTLASMNSPRLGEVARAALPVYENCRAQCEKHADKHEICKKCAATCVDVKKAVDGLG